MIQENIILLNKLGLHTRAAAKLVEVVSHFKSDIELINRDQTTDCRSIISVILLGATKGTELEMHISGIDEKEMYQAIIGLIHNKFGEEE